MNWLKNVHQFIFVKNSIKSTKTQLDFSIGF